MPRLSTVLLPTTSAALDNVPYDVTGEKHKGDGYYGFSDGLHTVAEFLDGVVAKIVIQGTLSIDPLETDWVNIDTRLGSIGPVGGYAEALLTPAQNNTNTPLDPIATTYDFNVTIDGGAVQLLSFTTVGTEDYTAIAALMNAVVVGGTVLFVDSAFRVTSSTAGTSSTATITPGSAGSAGGDLFTAILTDTGVATSFPTPTTGASAPLTMNATFNFTGNYVWVRAVVTDLEFGTITKIQMNY